MHRVKQARRHPALALMTFNDQQYANCIRAIAMLRAVRERVGAMELPNQPAFDQPRASPMRATPFKHRIPPKAAAMTATSSKPRATAGAPMLLPLALLLLLAPLPQPAAAKEQTLPLIANLLSAGLSGLSSLGGAPGATTGTGLRGAGPGEAQGASQSGPDLGSLFKTVFQLACPVLPISLPPFPIRADALCESTGMGQPNNQMACSIFDMLGGMISNPPLNCNPAAISMPASVDAAGVPMWMVARGQGRGHAHKTPHEMQHTQVWSCACVLMCTA
jgi:hypothetical protein